MKPQPASSHRPYTLVLAALCLALCSTAPTFAQPDTDPSPPLEGLPALPLTQRGRPDWDRCTREQLVAFAKAAMLEIQGLRDENAALTFQLGQATLARADTPDPPDSPGPRDALNQPQTQPHTDAVAPDHDRDRDRDRPAQAPPLTREDLGIAPGEGWVITVDRNDPIDTAELDRRIDETRLDIEGGDGVLGLKEQRADAERALARVLRKGRYSRSDNRNGYSSAELAQVEGNVRDADRRLETAQRNLARLQQQRHRAGEARTVWGTTDDGRVIMILAHPHHADTLATMQPGKRYWVNGVGQITEHQARIHLTELRALDP